MVGFQRTRRPAHRLPGYKTGRPSLYRPEYCDMVIEHMAKGHSLTGFAGVIQVNLDTVYEWQTKHPEFSEAVHIGRSARVNALERKLLSADKSAQAATSIFALKNACPDEYAEVRNLKVEHNVKLEQMTNEQLREIASRRKQLTIEHQPAATADTVTADTVTAAEKGRRS